MWPLNGESRGIFDEDKLLLGFRCTLISRTGLTHIGYIPDIAHSVFDTTVINGI